jgi:hypothetical protein
MKICSLILIVSFCVFSSAAQTPPKIAEKSPQEPCKMKLSESPTLRGLRLDMPKALVQKEYPRMTFTPDPVKSSGMALSNQISNPEYQKNLDRITVIFRNDKVFSILLTYNNSIPWESAEEFADKISQSLNLPRAAERKNAVGIYYSVNCGEFGVRTRINNEKQPTLLLTKDPNELWESSQEKKDAFKP